ncbi:hypothetical protein ACFX2I_010563 [Malus domestica]
MDRSFTAKDIRQAQRPELLFGIPTRIPSYGFSTQLQQFRDLRVQSVNFEFASFEYTCFYPHLDNSRARTGYMSSSRGLITRGCREPFCRCPYTFVMECCDIEGGLFCIGSGARSAKHYFENKYSVMGVEANPVDTIIDGKPQVLALRRPFLHKVLDYEDEFFLLMLILETHSLRTTDASFSELLYGLRRRAVKIKAMRNDDAGLNPGDGIQHYGLEKRHRFFQLCFWTCCLTLSQNCIQSTIEKGKRDFKQVYGDMLMKDLMILTHLVEERMLLFREELRIW